MKLSHISLRSLSLACLSLLFACAGARPDPLDPVRSHDLARAQELLAKKSYDEALLITDRLLRANAKDREALLIAAHGNRGLARVRPKHGQAFLTDATSKLEQALAIKQDDPETRILLADTYLLAGRFEDGRDAALQAAGQMREAGASNDQIATAVLKAAENEMQIFVASRRPELAAREKPSTDTLELAGKVLSRLAWVKQTGKAGAAHAMDARVKQWLSQTTQALAEMERGLTVAPGDAALHQAYQSLYQGLNRRTECVAAYQRMIRNHPGSPLMTWFLGIAQVALADEHRAKSRWRDAVSAYAAAAESFGRYLALMPQHAENTNHWIAVCELSMGRMAIEAGDLDAARAHYEQAFSRYPQVAESDGEGKPLVRDDFGDFYLNGLFQIGVALTSSSTPDALAKSLAHYEWVIRKHPDKFGSIYNNAGLSARDLGVAVARSARAEGLDEAERERRTKHALELWEKSYGYYRKAVELSPEDPRIINDCALMLVYHLHRDYDRAAKLLHTAIRIGEAKLKDLPEDAEQRQFLEEAVGDAWQNIAVMMRNQGKSLDEYRSYLRSALRYYPYARRAAARMLTGAGPRGGLRPRNTRSGTPRRPGRGRGGSRGGADPREATFVRAAKESETKASAGDLDGALLVLDHVAKELRGFAPFHALMGRYSLRYANASRRRGGGAAQIDGLFADAVSNLQEAVRLDGRPIRPRLELAQAYHDKGNFTAAAREAARLLGHIRSEGGTQPEWLMQTHRLRAVAGARSYIQAKQEKKEKRSELEAARVSFRVLEQAGKLDESLIQTWTTLEQWAGATDQAFAIFVRSLQRTADSSFLLGQIVDVAAKAQRSAKAVAALGKRHDATGIWYLGKARFNLAQEQWAAGKNDEALQSLRQAILEFDSSRQANPAYAASSKQWMALCQGSKGFILLGQDRIEMAEKALLESARLGPERIGDDLGGGNTTKRGIMIVADRFLRKKDLAHTERIYAAATRAAPADVDFANNHGLMARDLGSELEKQGEAAKAKAMFEASYASYTRASELQPDSVRLANDRALLLIYHLRRDVDEAKAILLAAIARGAKQLAQDPPADAGERRNLDEATGDAWENLGYYHMTFSKDLAAARRAFQTSMTHYPFDRRAGKRHLQTLDRLEHGREKSGQDR